MSGEWTDGGRAREDTLGDSDLRAVRPEADVEGAKAMAAIKSRLLERPRSDVELGRYVLGRKLGAGGMGVVYQAYDPQLQRDVAIKLMRPEIDDPDGRRLVREARAIAGLSSPAVVEVFDVGTFDDIPGVWDGGVYMVMELLHGPDLRRWSLAQKVDHVRMLRVLQAVGRGLAQIHAAGLAHADFKPDNVLLLPGDDVRIIDFGLVRWFARLPTQEQIDVETTGSQLISVAEGVVLGTPSYMAPELHAGARPTAASDQYAFCVSACELLFGRRPFRGDSLSALRRAQTHTPPTFAAAPHLPPHIARVLRRGLSPDPGARWPSMSALLHALVRRPAERRRRSGAVAAVGALVALSAAAWMGSDRADDQCTALAQRVDRMWTDDIRGEAKSAMVATGAYAGPFAAQGLADRIDGFAAQFGQTHAALCEGAPPPVGDDRLACLDVQVAGVERLVGQMREPDLPFVLHEHAFRLSVPRPDACEDASWAAAHRQAPTEAALAEADRMRIELERAAQMGYHGSHWDVAFDAAVAIGERAEALGVEDVVARAAMVRGHSALITGRHDAATEALTEAYDRSVEHGFDPIGVEAAGHMVSLLSRSGRYDEFPTWARMGEAAMARVGHYPELEGGLAMSIGIAERMAGDLDGARAHLLEAVEAFAEAGGMNPSTLSSLNELGAIEQAAGNLDEAREYYERSLAYGEELLGPDHPETATFRANTAGLRHQQGDLKGAREGLERAIAAFEDKLGPGDVRIGYALVMLADVDTDEGEFDDATERLDRATQIFETTYGAQHPAVAEIPRMKGEVARRTGRLDAAATWMRESLRMAQLTYGDAHPAVAQAMLGLAEIAIDAGDAEAAVAQARDALQRVSGPGGDAHLRTEALEILARAEAA